MRPMADDIQTAAEALREAYRSMKPIDPITPKFADVHLSTAYEIALAQVQHWEKNGDAVKGHKVGLASRAIQRQMGVDQPDFGHLTASMFHLEHAPIPADTFIQPRIEPEIAFVLGKSLTGPGVTVAEAIAAVDFVLPHWRSSTPGSVTGRSGRFDTIADNASSGGVMPAAARHGCPTSTSGWPAATSTWTWRPHRERCRWGGSRVADQLTGVAGQHSRTVGRHVGTRTCGPARIDDQGDCRSKPGDTIAAHIAGLGTVTAVMEMEKQ